MERKADTCELEDAIRISNLFETLSENGKTMALVYLSALRDKELADRTKAELVG